MGDFSSLGVVGAGTMGSGIAQVAAQQGLDVVLLDASPELAQAGIARMQESLGRAVERGRLSKEQASAALGRVRPVAAYSELDSVDAVIEAVVEDLRVKRGVFQLLEEHCPAGVLLATNTSSLSVSELATVTREPGRVVGLHFFNPVPAMALVEVIRGGATQDAAAERAADLACQLGKTPVQVIDGPGFLVNRVARPFYTEALRLLDEGVGTVPAIDRAMRNLGFRMGPFELMDLIGNDVNLAVTTSIFEQMYGEPRFRPSYSQKRLVNSGWLGQKSGRGWYSYDAAGKPQPTSASRDQASVDKVAPPVPAGPAALGLAAAVVATLDRNEAGEGVSTIGARILALLVNEAAWAVTEGIAEPAGVDTGVRLGLNYPRGLLEWGDMIGLHHVVEFVDELQTELHDDRYRVAPVLRRLVQAGWTGRAAGRGFFTYHAT